MRTNIYLSLKSQATSLLPIFLSGIILIGLIIYDLKKTHVVSDYKKKVILYSEIVLSFIASFALLMYMYYLLYPSWFIIFPLGLILTSPFGLTIIRVFLQNKSYDMPLSILTIISTLFSMFFTFKAATPRIY
jgi:hypothetical protein